MYLIIALTVVEFTADLIVEFSFGFWRMTATGWVGAMLYRGLQSFSPEAVSKYSSTICFRHASR